jgi:hypothetical protein
VDPDGVAACGATCWDLIACVYNECDGDGTNITCVSNACAEFLGSVSEAQLAGSAVQQCPESCGLSGSGTAGTGMVGGSGGAGSGGAGGMVAGGAGGFGGGGGWPGLDPAPDDVYVVASCQQGITASTCGSTMFDSVIDIRRGSLGYGPQACSEDYNMCEADPLGAATNTYSSPGLVFIVVDGTRASEAGEYQMSVIY